MRLGGTGAVGGIEAYPAEMVNIGVRPGVARGMGLAPVAMRQITADITGRNAKGAAHGAENVGVILADAAALLQRLGAGGVHVGIAGAIFDVVGDGGHDLVQRRDDVAVDGVR